MCSEQHNTASANASSLSGTIPNIQYVFVQQQSIKSLCYFLSFVFSFTFHLTNNCNQTAQFAVSLQSINTYLTIFSFVFIFLQAIRFFLQICIFNYIITIVFLYKQRNLPVLLLFLVIHSLTTHWPYNLQFVLINTIHSCSLRDVVAERLACERPCIIPI